MKNTSRKNLVYQSKVLIEGLRNETESIYDISDIDMSDIEQIKETLEGLKEIKIALSTLTN
tara:strand:- start:1242 stop:1424 length:183 start_codon:yes stop_codon:yes gene_type:complete